MSCLTKTPLMLRNITSYLESNPNSTARQISEGTDIPKRQVNGILYKYRNQHYSCVYSNLDHPRLPYWSISYTRSESPTTQRPEIPTNQRPEIPTTQRPEIPTTARSESTPSRHNPTSDTENINRTRFWIVILIVCLYYLNQTPTPSTHLCLTS
jgi:hypothetical protein